MSPLARLMSKNIEKRNYQYQKWKVGHHRRSYRHADKFDKLDENAHVPQKSQIKKLQKLTPEKGNLNVP